VGRALVDAELDIGQAYATRRRSEMGQSRRFKCAANTSASPQ
jgi:hypothetical protein